MNPPTRWVPLDALLLVVRDGDERGWQAEFDHLWAEQADYMDMLATSIQETGLREPVLIGSDGRLWDGHHRLAAAHKLGIATVPVEWAGEPASIAGSVSDFIAENEAVMARVARWPRWMRGEA